MNNIPRLVLPRRSFLAGAGLAGALGFLRLAQAATPAEAGVELVVLSSGGFTAAFRLLAPKYAQASGDTTRLVLGASMGDTPTAIPNRLARGEPADVVIMVGYALDKLIADGRAVPGSRVDLARSYIGVAVRVGAPKPDISTVDALRATLLAAKSIAYSDSASGVYLEKQMFPRLGIAEQMHKTARMIPGDPVGGVVARGDAELGFQQISELKPVPGIDIIGPIPAAVQSVTVFSAGIAAGSTHQAEARKLIAFLASPAAADAVRATGMETMG
jgi:molybdate transport system substrate-binding protein